MALKPRRFSISIPEELMPLVEQRMKSEHFSSVNKLVLSEILFDLITQCPHDLTGPIVNDPPGAQAKVFQEIIKWFPEGKKKKSPWLIAQIIKIREQERGSRPRPEE